MKTNDKVLVAVLVSMGLFSGIQAAQYVSTLSSKEKAAMLPAVTLAASQSDIIVESPIPTPVSENLVPERFSRNV